MSVTLNQAKFGTGVYGTAQYGQFIVDINIGVTATTVVASVEPQVKVSATAVTANFGVMFNVESGLTLDGTLDEGELSGSYATRTNNIVHAGELTLPSSFTETVPFWEHGGSGVGAWFGVAKISNVFNLRVRSGEGDTSVNLLSDDTDVVIANVPISQIPEFDGNTHTVVWDLRPQSGGRVRLWIDGRLIIEQETSGGANLENNSWSGGNAGGWGIGKSSIAGGTTDSGGTQFQSPAERTWSGTIKSGLRFYAGELVSFDDPFSVHVSEITESVSATGSIASVNVKVTRAVTPVTASFAISTTTNVDVQEDPSSGATATFAIASVDVAIQEDVGSVSASFNIASVSIGNIDAPTSGVSGSTNTPSLQVDVSTNTVTGVSASTVISDATNAFAGSAIVDLTGVSATGSFAITAAGTDLSTPLTAVTATGTIDSVGIDSEVTISSAATATGAIAGLILNITEVMQAVTATGAIGTVEPQTSEATESATASIVAGSLNQVKVSERLQAVTASGAINTLTQVKTSAGLDTVEAQGAIASVGIAVDSPTLTTILSSFTVASIAPDITEVTGSVSATGVIGTTSATGVQFDFEAVKELYDRFRTVYVEGFTQTSSERTVYVPTELRKIYVEGFSTSAERRARVSKAA